MGGVVVWDLGVIDPALSLPDQQLVQEESFPPGLPLIGGKSAWLSVCRMGRTPSSGGQLPLLLELLPPPFFSPDKLRNIDCHLVVTDGTIAPLLG